MKRSLLLGTALISAMTALSQARVDVTPKDGRYLLEKEFKKQHSAEPASVQQPLVGPQEQPSTARAAMAAIGGTLGWSQLSGSFNAFGVLYNYQKFVQYDQDLNVVAFIHRKSPWSAVSPAPTFTGSISGAINGFFTEDFGLNWDSTTIWNNNTLYARYPQGAIYHSAAPSNTDITQAQLITCGPITTQSGGWTGAFYASKQIDTTGSPLNTNVSNSSASIYMPNTPPFGALGKMEFPDRDLSVTYSQNNSGIGVARAIGNMVGDPNGTTAAAYAYRGAGIATGVYVSGAFLWQPDSIIPTASSTNAGNRMWNDVYVNSSTGDKNVYSTARMTWDETGDIGYVWFIACSNNTTLPMQNRGYQPLVYKSIDGGVTWTSVPRIDFTNPTMKSLVSDHILPTRTNTAITIPWFNVGESMDATVDKNGELHIFTTITQHYSSVPDSLAYIYTGFTIGTEKYTWAFDTVQMVPGGRIVGSRPYIYDFMTAGNSWSVTMIDSMSTEGPGVKSTEEGYFDNPWTDGPQHNADKIDANAMIQASRTADGKYIVLTWAESDTLQVNAGHKWNQLPNVKARLITVGNSGAITVHPTKLNLTRPGSSIPGLSGKATLHHASPKCAVISTSVSPNIVLALPMTVSNSSLSPMDHNATIRHWYSSVMLNFSGVATTTNNIHWPVAPRRLAVSHPKDTSHVGLNEKSLDNAFSVYPNPAVNNVVVSINSVKGGKSEITVMSVTGQVVRTINTSVVAGQNNIAVDLNGVSAGVYMVSVKSDRGTYQTKLILE